MAGVRAICRCSSKASSISTPLTTARRTIRGGWGVRLMWERGGASSSSSSSSFSWGWEEERRREWMAVRRGVGRGAFFCLVERMRGPAGVRVMLRWEEKASSFCFGVGGWVGGWVVEFGWVGGLGGWMGAQPEQE